MKSPKECSLERKIIRFLKKLPVAEALAGRLFADPELQAQQEYANTVSIRRLGFNDHGPVHMRKVAFNALQMLSLLHDAGIPTSLEQDEAGSYEDSACAVLLAAMLHDIGMSIGRHDHEHLSCLLGAPFIDRSLADVLPGDETLARRVAIRSIALEGIVGHMTTIRIHSLEAGIILVGDGCDMEKGRARITMAVSSGSHMGDIHMHSANSIQRVSIGPGEKLPIRIDVEMDEVAGLFQVEEILMRKIDISPAKPYIELTAGLPGQPRSHYL